MNVKPMIDLNRSSVARYIQLASLFRRRIESGDWPVGRQIPTVNELAEECGVARATIRQALDIIEDEGLIERFRAKGTFVRPRKAERLWYQVGTEWSGLLQSTQGATIEILSDLRNVPLPDILYPIGSPAGAYRHLRRRHWRDSQPFLLANVYIDERLSDRIGRADIETKTALRLIADVPGLEIQTARQTLTIDTADVETADSLKIAINAPVALVHRRVVDSEGVLILAADGIYRGDQTRVDIVLR
jgi:GntR family transcriptional regulator